MLESQDGTALIAWPLDIGERIWLGGLGWTMRGQGRAQGHQGAAGRVSGSL